MKITLIKPKLGHSKDGAYRDRAVMEPLVMAILKALTPDDVEVVFFDDRIEKINFDDETDLVAITVETFTALRSYQIAYEYRKRGVKVILGGYHPTHMAMESIQYADSVYIGDAEDKWPEVISDLKTGELKQFYHSTNGMSTDCLIPDRSIFKGKKYLPVGLVQFSRGCYFDCNFCSVSSFYNKKYHFKAIDHVLEEIESQPRKLLLFADDNVVMNHKLSKDLFRELIPLKIKWASEADINMANDLELMDLMKESGCIGQLIGFESVEVESLRAMKKIPNLVKFDTYKEKLKILKDYGLFVWGAFTIGHDSDTQRSIDSILEFSKIHKFILADFNVLMPYPKTPLYNQLAKENRLLYNGKWWLHPDYRFGKSTFIPVHFSPDELADACYEARLKYFTLGSILRRAFDFKVNMRSLYSMGIYSLLNFLSYNDAIKKQDIILGAAGAVDVKFN
ncbi:B12-binding domain-containing radical SAM protein [Aestuariivivens sediminicola]|uniref:B12-binding domain-containing radical SAM protein n=1 Tax=Aestuariivivens sediminicola TaxID=2913560 RepID=UPI001F55E993|nr:radical SAM protein [Aestuariivivens sediminicola]